MIAMNLHHNPTQPNVRPAPSPQTILIRPRLPISIHLHSCGLQIPDKNTHISTPSSLNAHSPPSLTIPSTTLATNVQLNLAPATTSLYLVSHSTPQCALEKHSAPAHAPTSVPTTAKKPQSCTTLRHVFEHGESCEGNGFQQGDAGPEEQVRPERGVRVQGL